MRIIGKITILKETTKHPITLIGERAGICYGADISDANKNYQRGMDCILSNHGRALEYVNVEMVIEGYSARVLREYYTHIGGAPTRLQASTRYINYANFDCVIPQSALIDQRRLKVYEGCINDIKENIKILQALKMPQEDIALLLPLGMQSKMVDKRNLRNLIEMSHQRECRRANWEYREMFYDIKDGLRNLSDEWEWIVRNLFIPKCKFFGKCTERKSCGKLTKEKSTSEKV